MRENSISVDRRSGILELKAHRIVVRSRYGSVFINIDGAIIELTTIVAHRIGLDLVCKANDCLPSEQINVNINNKKLGLLPTHATQIGGALLRKADDADDWQLENLKPKRVLQ